MNVALQKAWEAWLVTPAGRDSMRQQPPATTPPRILWLREPDDLQLDGSKVLGRGRSGLVLLAKYRRHAMAAKLLQDETPLLDVVREALNIGLLQEAAHSLHCFAEPGLVPAVSVYGIVRLSRFQMVILMSEAEGGSADSRLATSRKVRCGLGILPLGLSTPVWDVPTAHAMFD